MLDLTPAGPLLYQWVTGPRGYFPFSTYACVGPIEGRFGESEGTGHETPSPHEAGNSHHRSGDHQCLGRGSRRPYWAALGLALIAGFCLPDQLVRVQFVNMAAAAEQRPKNHASIVGQRNILNTIPDLYLGKTRTDRAGSPAAT